MNNSLLKGSWKARNELAMRAEATAPLGQWCIQPRKLDVGDGEALSCRQSQKDAMEGGMGRERVAQCALPPSSLTLFDDSCELEVSVLLK